MTNDFFFSSRRRHTRSKRDWSSDVCSSDLRLANGVDQSRTFATNMRRVSASVRCYVFLERDQLLGREERAGQINQPGAEAHRPIAHRRVDQGTHLLHLGVGWMSRRLTHHRLADRARAAVRPEIYGGPALRPE